jgi:hypothetical protein
MSHFGLLREENDRTNLDYLEDSPLVMPWVRRCDLRSTSVAREARRYRSWVEFNFSCLESSR